MCRRTWPARIREGVQMLNWWHAANHQIGMLGKCYVNWEPTHRIRELTLREANGKIEPPHPLERLAHTGSGTSAQRPCGAAIQQRW